MIKLATLSKWEQETIINYNQDSKTASCYTHDKALMRKLDLFCEKSSAITVKREGEGWKEYSLPKKWVKVVFPRQLSDETRKKLSEQARRNLGGDRK